VELGSCRRNDTILGVLFWVWLELPPPRKPNR
jgi:hypothetical protein